MQKFKNLLFLSLFFVLISCTYVKRQLSSTKTELPPVRISNVAYVKGDEVPVVKTVKGFVKAPIKGVPVEEPKAIEYRVFTGVSN